MLTAIICIIGLFVIASAIWNYRNSYVLSKDIKGKKIDDPKYWELRYKYEFMVATFSIVVTVIGFIGYSTYENAIARLRTELEIKNNATNKQLKEAEEKANVLSKSVENYTESAKFTDKKMMALEFDLKEAQKDNTELSKEIIYLDSYFKYGIKSDLDQVREMQNNLKDKLNNEVKDYLVKSQQEQTEIAIRDLESYDLGRLNKGTVYFTYNKYIPLTDKQIERMVNFIKNPNVPTNYKPTFATILMFYKSKYTDEYFENVLTRNDYDSNFKSIAMQYFLINDFNNSWGILKKALITSDNRMDIYLGIVSILQISEKSKLIDFLNNKEIINSVYEKLDKDQGQIGQLRTNVENNIPQDDKASYMNTYFFQKMKVD